MPTKIATRSKKPRKKTGGEKKNSKALKLNNPQWDSTSRDLSVHKISKTDLELRHQAHQSKNIELAKHELYDKAKVDLDSSGNLRPSPLNSGARAKKLTALQKSLHGRELHDVLAESDQTMRVVKDLFGDDFKRYSCVPNVTMAPHVKEDKIILEQTLLESQPGGPSPTAHASPGGIRDKNIQQELVQRKPALNELVDNTTTSAALDYDGDVSNGLTPSLSNQHRTTMASASSNDIAPYKPALDLKRFQKLVSQEKKKQPGVFNNSTLSETQRLREGTRPRRSTSGSKDCATTTVKSSGSDTGHGRYPVAAGGSGRFKALKRDTGSGVQEEYGDPAQGYSGRKLDCNAPQYEQKDSDVGNGSVAGVSDISSIPMDPDMLRVGGDVRGNITVDSDASSVYHAPSSSEAQRRGDVSSQQRALSHRQGAVPNQQGLPHMQQGPSGAAASHQPPRGGASNQQSASNHPLQISHKMPGKEEPVSHSKKGHRVYSDLGILEKLVHNLDQELLSYEKTISPSLQAPTSSHGPSHGSQTAGPQSLDKVVETLVSSVRRMVHYLHQSEVQLKGEVAIRGQFLQTLHEQQDLMDVLTADLITVKRENVMMKRELAKVEEKASEEITQLKRDLKSIMSSLTHKKSSAYPITNPYQPSPLPPPPAPAATTLPSGESPPATQLSSHGPQPPAGLLPTSQPGLPPPPTLLPGPTPQSDMAWSLPNLSIDDTFSSAFSQVPFQGNTEDVSFVTGDGTGPSMTFASAFSQVPSQSKPSFAVNNKSITDPRRNIAKSVSGEGVLFAQVSPLSYDSFGKEIFLSRPFDPQITSVSQGTDHPFSIGQSSKIESLTNDQSVLSSQMESKLFLESLYAPAPPPLSVALDVPTPSVSQSHSRVGEDDNWEPKHRNSHLSIEVHPPGDQGTSGGDDKDDNRSNSLPIRVHPPSMVLHPNEDQEKATSAGDQRCSLNLPSSSVLLSNGNQGKPTLSPPPGNDDITKSPYDEGGHDLISRTNSSLPPTGDMATHSGTANDSTFRSTMDPGTTFDVAGLFESLQKLNRTQGELQATADRLRSQKSTGPPSSNPVSTTETKEQTMLDISGDPQALNLKYRGGRLNEGTALTSIDEESTLTSSQIESMLEDGHSVSPEQASKGRQIPQDVSVQGEIVPGGHSVTQLPPPAARDRVTDELNNSGGGVHILKDHKVTAHNPIIKMNFDSSRGSGKAKGSSGDSRHRTWFALSSHLT